MSKVEVARRLAVKLLVVLAEVFVELLRLALSRACACVLAYVRVRARYWETLVFPVCLSFPFPFLHRGCRGEVLFSLPLSFDMQRGVVDNSLAC